MIRFLCVAALSLSVNAFAQAPKTAPKPTAKAAAKPAEQKQTPKDNPPKASAVANQEPPKGGGQMGPAEALVKVTIETSRPEVTTDGSYGIFADLENVGSVALTLYPVETVLVIQPEVAGNHECVFSIDGFYPTEDDKIKKPPQGGPIIIQPKEHYVAFWDVTKVGTGHCQGQGQSEERSLLERAGSEIIEQLSFVPGDYAFVVVGKAHLTPTLGGKEESGYHTFTEHIKLHVGLTQLNAVLASAFGGLLGYFVMALRGGKEGQFGKLKTEQEEGKRHPLSRLGVILRGVVSAGLVSAVVTVLLARISDTQFPIKVSVADFWGALTVGFVAFFSGNNLIDRIVGFATKKDPGGGPDAAPPNQAGGNSAPPNQTGGPAGKPGDPSAKEAKPQVQSTQVTPGASTAPLLRTSPPKPISEGVVFEAGEKAGSS